MKKLKLFSIITFCFLGLIARAKDFPVDIHLLDGSTNKGFANFNVFNADKGTFLYSKEENGKSIKLKSDDIQKVIFHTGNNNKVEIHRTGYITFWLVKSMKPKPTKKKFWLVLLKKNKKMSFYSTASGGIKINNKGELISRVSYIEGRTSGEFLYLYKRPNEEIPTVVSQITAGSKMIGENNAFIRSITEYLKDDPKLCKEIEDKKYKNEDVETIFDLYTK